MKERYRIAVIAGIVVAMIVYAASLAPIPQDPAYHHFADQRTLFGIATFMDVFSNVPFLLVGTVGLLLVFRGLASFATAAERWPYIVLFFGVAATSAGSAYYHIAPDNARLVWDRLPMTLGFMGMLSAVLAERVNRTLGVFSLPLLVALGVASVVYWNATEMAGHGDLRPYLLVQFGSLIILSICLPLFPSRYTHQGWLVLALFGYGLAKLLELFDERVFDALRIVSGHTLKHFAAAAASYCLVCMLNERTPADAQVTPSRSVAQAA